MFVKLSLLFHWLHVFNKTAKNSDNSLANVTKTVPHEDDQ